MSRKHKRQAPRTAAFPQAAGKSSEFNPDYSTTKRELKRIGILAGTFIALLILLSFFQDRLLALFIK
jgi:hypothetical protein